MTLEWEPITDSRGSQDLDRARVHGGWLVRAVSHIDGGHDQLTSAAIQSWLTSITFVPDPTWRWGQEQLPLTESTPCENCGMTLEACLRGSVGGTAMTRLTRSCCDKCLHGGKAE